MLVVGAANSGAEIALDLVRAGRRVWLSGRNPGEVPFPIENRLVIGVILPILFRLVFHRILTVDTPMGRRGATGFHDEGTAPDPHQVRPPRSGRSHAAWGAPKGSATVARS